MHELLSIPLSSKGELRVARTGVEVAVLVDSGSE